MAASTAPVNELLENDEKCPENVDGALFQNVPKTGENAEELEIDLSVKCRGCFVQEDEMHFLFTVFDQDLSLADILRQTTSFECRVDDNLPPYLCTKCTSSLVDFFNFKIQFEKTDTYVRALLGKDSPSNLGSVEVKPEVDNDSDFETVENYFENDSQGKEGDNFETFKKFRSVKIDKYIPDIEQVSGITTDCTICANKFTTISECETHLAKYHGINPFSKFGTFKQLILDHDRTAIIEKRKQKYLAEQLKEMEIFNMPGKLCRFCQRKFPEEQFQDHWDTHKIHICEMCGFKAIKKSDVSMHQVTVHSNARNFPCSHCKKTFKTKGLRKRHEMSIHINPRAFCCELCGQRFNDHATMKTHFRLKHVGNREFVCPICGLDFPLKATLNKHILRHNRNRPPAHYCQICSNGFKDKSSLRRHHLVKHTNDFVRPRCDFCGKTYCSKTKLRFHVERHHSGNPPVQRGRGRGRGRGRSRGAGTTCRWVRQKSGRCDLDDSTSVSEEGDDTTTESDSESSDENYVIVENEPKVKVEY